MQLVKNLSYYLNYYYKCINLFYYIVYNLCIYLLLISYYLIPTIPKPLKHNI